MKKYILENLDCANCAAKLESSIKKLDCVKSVSIDFGTLSMLIETTDINKVQKEIEKIEPEVKIIDTNEKKSEEQEENFNPKTELIFIGITAFIYILGLIFQKQLEGTTFHLAEYVLFLGVYLMSGWKVLFNAFKNISKGRVFDENFLMTIATVGAIAIHALAEAVGVMLFYKVGEFLQELSVQNSRRNRYFQRNTCIAGNTSRLCKFNSKRRNKKS